MTAMGFVIMVFYLTSNKIELHIQPAFLKNIFLLKLHLTFFITERIGCIFSLDTSIFIRFCAHLEIQICTTQ